MQLFSTHLWFTCARLFIPQLVSPVRSQRCVSIFSSIRLKREAAKEKSERAKQSDADREGHNLWSEAVSSLDPTSYAKPDQDSHRVSRIKSRRLKKQAFLQAIRFYLHRYEKSRRGFNQFVRNALDKMAEYEVQTDLECYKAILSVFPTGRMVVTSFLQAELGHFTRQQNTVVDLLHQMTINHVLPDDEVGQMIIDIFGWRNHAMQHYRQLMYWMPKLKHANPWPVEAHQILDDLEEDPLRLCRLIVERICPDPMTELRTIKLPTTHYPSGPPCSLVSGQSPEQRALLSHSVNAARTADSDRPSKAVIYLDGPHFVWYYKLQAAYYTLWTELDRRRLQSEIEHANQRKISTFTSELSKLSLTCPPGCVLRTRLDEVHPHKTTSWETSVPSLPQAQYDSIAKQAVLDMNNALLNHPPAQTPRVQPEYDTRWNALRRSHSYTFLPAELTTHEQAEGNILALAVVTPIADALLHQKCVFDHAVSIECGSQASTEALPSVPQRITSELLRAWIKDLQYQNPSLENATLIIRTQAVSGDSYHSHADDRCDISVQKTNERLVYSE